jgi:hypothetical protein
MSAREGLPPTTEGLTELCSSQGSGRKYRETRYSPANLSAGAILPASTYAQKVPAQLDIGDSAALQEDLMEVPFEISHVDKKKL